MTNEPDPAPDTVININPGEDTPAEGTESDDDKSSDDDDK
jgi:hypothetical protein